MGEGARLRVREVRTADELGGRVGMCYFPSNAHTREWEYECTEVGT